MRKITPKSLVLELLQVAEGQTISVKELVAAGELFAFRENTIRVVITRLLRDQLIESDERGFYRASMSIDPLSHYIRQWYLGLKRMKAWDGRWIVIHISSLPSLKLRREHVRALDLMGFREGLSRLWVRPNNIRKEFPQVIQELYSLGLDSRAECFIADTFRESLVQLWQQSLWSLEQREHVYEQLKVQLRNSLKKQKQIAHEQALVETLVLGGEVIRVLARDPLLPTEIASSKNFAELTELMLRYDEWGREVWAQFLKPISLTSTMRQVQSQ